jgi:hypothetical protein
MCGAFQPKTTFEEAATIPSSSLTAWHALKDVAHVRAAEHILIHAGAGGVGMAAVQIAHLGAEVIATTGSPAKRALLGTPWRSACARLAPCYFAEAVMERPTAAGGRGANSLAGEAIPMVSRVWRSSAALSKSANRHLSELAHSAESRCAATRRSRGRDGRRLAGNTALTRDMLRKLQHRRAGRAPSHLSVHSRRAVSMQRSG